MGDQEAIGRSLPALRTRQTPRETAESGRVRACRGLPLITAALGEGSR